MSKQIFIFDTDQAQIYSARKSMYTCTVHGWLFKTAFYYISGNYRQNH